MLIDSLTDDITEDQVVVGEGNRDGLPRSLEANCQAYGLRAFKLKIGGDAAASLDRLSEIAAVLDRSAMPYMCTLDGNEQFAMPEEFEALWLQMKAVPHLKRFVASIAYVEQPIARKFAMSVPLGRFGERTAVEIDESDANIDAFPKARSLGYRGVSSKSCKGVYRSLLNRCRAEHWNAQVGVDQFFLSAEDLCTQVGTALEQDLALAALIGCTDIERNGYQYGDGMAGCQQAEREAVVARRPDLYRLEGNRANLRIVEGTLSPT